MNAFDFDELDRAVSQALGATPQPAKTAAEPPKEDVDTTPTSEPSLPTTPSTPAESPKQAQASEAATVASPTRPSPGVRRTSGKFMDVVHPSAVVRTATPPARVSRQGVTIAPVEPQSQQPSTSPKEPSVSPAETEAPHDEATPVLFDDTDAVMLPPETALLPLESPFLGDTQVEKRPLGAFSTGDGTADQAPEAQDDDSTEAPATAPDAPPVDEPVATETIEPTAEPAADEALASDAMVEKPLNTALNDQLAEELRSDIVAIESAEVTPRDEVAATPTPASTPVAPEKPRQQGDIPRQYREKPQELSQEVASIYDVEGYQAPIKHPAKKKSGWTTVLWIVILIALGVGGGVAFYLLDPLHLTS